MTEEAESQSAQSAPIESKRKDGKGHRQESGVRKAARELGVDRDDARRAKKVASLTEEAKEAAKEVGLDDNRSALLEAAAKPPERQAATIREIAEAKAEAKKLQRNGAGNSCAAPGSSQCVPRGALS